MALDTEPVQMSQDIPRRAGNRAAGRAALETLLSDAALGDGGIRRFLPTGAAAKVAGGLAVRPKRVAHRVREVGAEFVTVARGTSEVQPPKGDRRFADPAWDSNWLLRRIMQAYLTLGIAADELIDDASVDWRSERQARFALVNLFDALAPTNFPWSNPVVLREIINQGGANLVRGARQFARDVSSPPRLPASVDTSKFDVGENLAATPGAVVLRTDVFELIQYKPQTQRVYETPLLFVPPTINKYYILDLAPGRSLIEHLVQQGQQVFAMSWRNPDAAQGHFDLDAYANAVLEARAAVADVTAHGSVHIAAACSGGIISAGALAHLAVEGRLSEVASLTLLVCALDNEQAGTAAALTTREVAAAAVAESARKGYLDGRALAGVFAWLRPNDLIWRYVINNYLLGKDPSAFDILYWNQDTVRLTAGLHRDFIRLALDNSLTRAGALSVLGTPVDLGVVDIDSYVVAGLSDHIVPWENAYRGARLFGRTPRFVLSTSGHIQALVNPSGPDSRASFRVADAEEAESEDWLTGSPLHQGSWWPDYVAWLNARSGRRMPAPRTLGSATHAPAARAPGSYVHAT
jgi:polyhydroxyalkanoate synthase